VMVIIPVNANKDKAQYIAAELWPKWCQCRENSNTMIVIKIASTPSLKASSLPFCMLVSPRGADFILFLERSARKEVPET
jgi:hypothetical protein